MSEENKISVGVMFKGTPIEIGQQLFTEIVCPVIQQAIQQEADARTIAQMYAGLVMAAYGAMACDIGEENSKTLINSMYESFLETVEMLATDNPLH